MSKVKGQRSSVAVWSVIAICLLTFDPAYAANSPIPGGSKHNNKAPIDVTSDSLEVMQQQNKAIFTGHVVAIQANTRLTADKMTVFYASGSDKKTSKKSTGKDNPQGAIKKIDAVGNVFLATPEETASGASGVYDVEHQEIHLNDQVTLTRGKNILKGDKLVYNFATGHSVVSSNGGETKAGKGRVHALFVPEDSKEKRKKNKTDDNNSD